MFSCKPDSRSPNYTYLLTASLRLELGKFYLFCPAKWHIVDLDRLGVSIGSSGAIELFIGDKTYRKWLKSFGYYHYDTYYNTILSLRLSFSPSFFFDGWRIHNSFYFVTFPFHEEKRNNFTEYNILIENRNPYTYVYISTTLICHSFLFTRRYYLRRCEISVAQP